MSPADTLYEASAKSLAARIALPFFVPLNLLAVPYYWLRYFQESSVSVEHGCLVIRSKQTLLRGQYVGIARGHVIVLSKAGDNVYTYRHELVHVEQVEAAGVAGLFVGLVLLATGTPWWASFGVWALLPVLVYAAASLVSRMRGDHGYRGNVWEEGARGPDGRSCEGP